MVSVTSVLWLPEIQANTIREPRPTGCPLQFGKNLRKQVIVRRSIEVQPVGIASFVSLCRHSTQQPII